MLYFLCQSEDLVFWIRNCCQRALSPYPVSRAVSPIAHETAFVASTTQEDIFETPCEKLEESTSKGHYQSGNFHLSSLVSIHIVESIKKLTSRLAIDPSRMLPGRILANYFDNSGAGPRPRQRQGSSIHSEAPAEQALLSSPSRPKPMSMLCRRNKPKNITASTRTPPLNNIIRTKTIKTSPPGRDQGCRDGFRRHFRWRTRPSCDET